MAEAVDLVAVRLPFPVKALSQNARGHWSKRAEATADARADAYAITREVMGDIRYAIKPGTPLRVEFTFHRGTKHRHDLLNLVGRMKAAVDGIADALGVDDVTVARSSAAWGDPVKGGAVTVVVGVLPNE